MPKIVVESGMVLNLGGFIVEKKAKLPCVDVIVGNPLPEDMKLDAPVYSEEMLREYERQGMFVEYLRDGESLKEKLEGMKKRVDEKLKG
ncbi:MAG: hypothetical protein GF416_02070 [Candidatus Altiarchaeales archaeon]|nr:hypothetical protein [Candidatus Altiarchaeales archaeon]MBD3415904.1 hypothetical protein [Candidatus Altiarchaeales archaeon]